MKNYKVFYKDNEVAEFDTIVDCEDYIWDMLKVDDLLLYEDFYIYSKVEL